MRIVVAGKGLDVASHFARCESLMCYTVVCGVITECQNMPNPGMPVDKLTELLLQIEVDVLIVGAIDYNIANMFCHAGVEVIAGAQGKAREVAQAYLTHTLKGVDELCHLDDWDCDDTEKGFAHV